MNLDPQTVRQRMIRSYTESYARAQVAMTPRQIEDQVVADCQIVDAARAAGDLSSSRPRVPSEPARSRVDPVAAAAAETNLRVGPSGRVIRSRVTHADPTAISERWGCAAARIKRIMEGVNRDTSSLVVAVESAELGELATAYAEAWANFTTRESLPPTTGPDRNPYRGMTTRDAARAFQRAVEDICDRSTGALGHWYVR